MELRPTESELARTFVLHNEDHTLGNALRHCLMQRENVTFCGYSVPHPLEAKMHLRVQTCELVEALDEWRKWFALEA